MYQYRDEYDDNFFYQEQIESRQQQIEIKLLKFLERNTKQFLKVLSSAHSVDCEHAIQIADMMSLDQLDFLAIDDDVNGYKKEYNIRNEWNRGEYEYSSM